MNKTTEPAALAGIEPVAVAERDYKRGDAVAFFARNDIPKGTKLYSAAAVERLVQERDGDRSEIEHLKGSIDVLREQLAASQAREQQLREALTVFESGSEQNHNAADSALALPQDDTALRQWGAKLLREISDGVIGVREQMILRRKADELEGKK